jgi:tetratricopeptide (TPR) repeat protein
MNKNQIAGIAMGILLAAQATPLFAQDVNVAALRDQYVPAALHQKGTSESPKATLERKLADGNAFLEQGNNEEALERFHWAMTLATEVESDADLTYAMYRTGLAHERIYERSGNLMNLKAAIAYWEQERTLYNWHEYPEGFHALAGFDLGRAYLTLARHEGLVENAQRGLAILDQSVKTFGGAVASYQAALRPLGAPEVK